MGCPARTGDDHFQSASLGILGVLEHPVWRAVRRYDLYFVWHPEFFQDVGRWRQRLIIALRSHDDSDQRRVGIRWHDGIIDATDFSSGFDLLKPIYLSHPFQSVNPWPS